jgi:hypothetical protein
MGNVVIDERLVKAAGKLQLLDRILKVVPLPRATANWKPALSFETNSRLKGP